MEKPLSEVKIVLVSRSVDITNLTFGWHVSHRFDYYKFYPSSLTPHLLAYVGDGIVPISFEFLLGFYTPEKIK